MHDLWDDYLILDNQLVCLPWGRLFCLLPSFFSCLSFFMQGSLGFKSQSICVFICVCKFVCIYKCIHTEYQIELFDQYILCKVRKLATVTESYLCVTMGGLHSPLVHVQMVSQAEREKTIRRKGPQYPSSAIVSCTIRFFNETKYLGDISLPFIFLLIHLCIWR